MNNIERLVNIANRVIAQKGVVKIHDVARGNTAVDLQQNYQQPKYAPRGFTEVNEARAKAIKLEALNASFEYLA